MRPVGEPIPAQEEELSIYTVNPDKVQRELDQALESNRPLDVTRLVSDDSSAHGDRLISVWALEQAIRLRYPGANPRFVLTQDPYGNPPSGFDIGGRMEVLAHHHRSRFGNTYREWRLSQYAEALGIDLRKSELRNQVPTPVKIEGDRVFGSFNLDRMRQDAQRLRETKEWEGRPIIVIYQSGSIPEKRFSDEQVQQVLEQVRRQNPDAVIIVVNDKQLLFLADRFPGEQRQPPYAYSSQADVVISADSLDTVGALAMTADQIITTDTLWAWWGAGCKVSDGEHPDKRLRPGELVELMTVAGEEWKIPGSEAVLSAAARSGKAKRNQLGIISNASYREFFSTSERGIRPEDMDAFLRQLGPRTKERPSLFRWFRGKK